MKSIELFEKAIGKINKYQNMHKKKVLDMNRIKGSIQKGELSEACKELHRFIKVDLSDDCFKELFPLTYNFDNNKIASKGIHKKKRNASNCGYYACFEKNEQKNKCIKCNCDGYVYGNRNQDQKAELDHFLTHLLFESVNGVDCPLMDKRIKENGLFILAAEVLGNSAEDLSNQAQKYAPSSSEVERAREVIRNILK